jgi:hypothetical protein
MTTQYFATRDSDNAQTDEDRAMAHAVIYRGDYLPDAQDALYHYMMDEAKYLLKPNGYRSPKGDQRAYDIQEAAKKALNLTPPDIGRWSHATIEVAGLVFQITGGKNG